MLSVVFFFKQKTAYEMRISDWSSDVCSSDLAQRREKHGWDDGRDYVPHDARVKEWGTGRTRVETMQSLGLHPEVVPQSSKLDGINAVRRTLPLCVFPSRCERSEESRVGKECVSTCRYRWVPDH